MNDDGTKELDFNTPICAVWGCGDLAVEQLDQPGTEYKVWYCAKGLAEHDALDPSYRLCCWGWPDAPAPLCRERAVETIFVFSNGYSCSGPLDEEGQKAWDARGTYRIPLCPEHFKEWEEYEDEV